MNIGQVLALYDRQERHEDEYPGMRREETPEVVRHISRTTRRGVVLYSRLSADNADAVIREQIDYFNHLGQDFEWKAYAHDTPADLVDRLRTHGLEEDEPEAIMVLDLEEAPASLWRPVTQDMRRIADADGLSDVIRILDAVWPGDHSLLEGLLAEEMRIDPEHLRIYVAYVDEVPASTAWVRFHDHSQFASLWGGSTVVQYRQRGLYHALLAVRAQEARRQGKRYLTIDAGAMSQPIVEKLGFQVLTQGMAMIWKYRPAKPF